MSKVSNFRASVNTLPAQIIDEGDLRKYRIELPNLLDDLQLSVYAFRLYVHIKRRTGANGGTCFEGARGMAETCKMSVGKVVSAKKELAAAGLIDITPGNPKTNTADLIRIRDMWAENFSRYQTCSPHEQGVHGEEQTCSPRERPCSPHERKKEPVEERTIEEKTHTHRAPRGARPVVVCGSQFSIEECRKYAEHLRATGQGINNPGGYATTIYRTGEADALIESYLNPAHGVQLPDASTCADCKGTGFIYADPKNHGKGVRKCKHPALQSHGAQKPRAAQSNAST